MIRLPSRRAPTSRLVSLGLIRTASGPESPSALLATYVPGTRARTSKTNAPPFAVVEATTAPSRSRVTSVGAGVASVPRNRTWSS